MLWTEHNFLFPAAAAVWAAVAMVTDLRSRRIPNWLTGSALLAGLVLHFTLEGWRGGLYALAAALIAGVLFLLMYLMGGMGAGDVKLIAGVAALAGIANLSNLLLYTVLAGGAMALVFALMRGQLRRTLLNVLNLVQHHRQNGLSPHPELNVRNASTLRMPYGLAIAAGCLLTLYISHTQR